jgi:L-asparaginase
MRMLKVQGSRAQAPLILVHGGMGSYTEHSDLLHQRQEFIVKIIDSVWPQLIAGAGATSVATQVIEGLEASPIFNAGLGSVIQHDGLARLTASVMNGTAQKFSGVMLVTHLIHPSKLAFELQNRDQTVLGPLGAQLLARELGLPPQNPATPERAAQWQKYLEKQTSGDGGHGTVGVVVLDLSGSLLASTSTGGASTNVPERVSDSATVAGNYASRFAAISCTGIGEQIVDDGIAVRLETRVRDGATMIAAAEKTFAEALTRQREYGWISIDHDGNWTMFATQEMPCAVMSRNRSSPLVGA